MAIVQAIGTAVQVAQGIQQVLAVLDTPRSCVITLKNYTSQRLELIFEQHESGGWKEPPNQYVDPNTVQIFGAGDSGFWTGAIGSCCYRIGPDQPAPELDDIVVFRYDNPWAGPNQASAAGIRISTVGSPAPPASWGHAAIQPLTTYQPFARAGVGEVGAPMLWELYPAP